MSYYFRRLCFELPSGTLWCGCGPCCPSGRVDMTSLQSVGSAETSLICSWPTTSAGEGPEACWRMQMLQELRALPHSGMTVTFTGTWRERACGLDCTTLVVEPQTQSQAPKSSRTSPGSRLASCSPLSFCTVSRPNLSGVGGTDLYTPGLFKKASPDLGLDARKIIGLSFWLDGVALKWDRSDSFDMLTMSIPGLVGPWCNLGVPLCVIKRSTWDDILTVVRWSLGHVALNAHPVRRHDAADWWRSDVKRKRCAGPLGCHGVLCQVLGLEDVQGHLPVPPAQREPLACVTCARPHPRPDDRPRTRRFGGISGWIIGA